MNSAVFASRLKEAMKASGLKQVDLLRQAEIQGFKLGKSQLSQYVSGKTTPRKATLNFLAQALDVDSEWLNPETDEQEGQHASGAAPSATKVADQGLPPYASSRSPRSSTTFSMTCAVPCSMRQTAWSRRACTCSS